VQYGETALSLVDELAPKARRMMELAAQLITIGEALIPEDEKARSPLILKLALRQRLTEDELILLADSIRWRPRGRVRAHLSRESGGSRTNYLDEKRRILLVSILQTCELMAVPNKIRFSPGIAVSTGGLAYLEDGTRPIPIANLSAAEFSWWFRKEVCRQAQEICRREMQIPGDLGSVTLASTGDDDFALEIDDKSVVRAWDEGSGRATTSWHVLPGEADDRRRVIAAALKGGEAWLSPLERRLVTLYRQEPETLSDGEAAVRLGSTRNSVRAAWRRIRSKIRARIRQ